MQSLLSPVEVLLFLGMDFFPFLFRLGLVKEDLQRFDLSPTQQMCLMLPGTPTEL